jgi:plastocyanin domain-containing protein
MTTSRLLLALVVLAACKNSPPAPPKAASGSGVVDVAVTDRGFEPDRVEAAPGQPVTLRITRTVAETCADAVQVQGDPVRHLLPFGKAVEVRVTAPPSGELAFACPMNMIRGTIVVVSRGG